MSEEASCPLWMVTFGDCMSLLVTFFVMLIAFSDMEEARLLDMVGALKGALGVQPAAGKQIQPISDDNRDRVRGEFETKQWLSIEDLSAVVPIAEMTVARCGETKLGIFERHVAVRMLDEGLAFIIQPDALFTKGTTELIPKGIELLGQIGTFAQPMDNEVRVMGLASEQTHVPTREFRSGWRLALERSSVVQRLLRDASGLTNDRVSAGIRTVTTDIEDSVADTKAGIQIVIVGRRRAVEMAPEEIIVLGKWHS